MKGAGPRRGRWVAASSPPTPPSQRSRSPPASASSSTSSPSSPSSSSDTHPKALPFGRPLAWITSFFAEGVSSASVAGGGSALSSSSAGGSSGFCGGGEGERSAAFSADSLRTGEGEPDEARFAGPVSFSLHPSPWHTDSRRGGVGVLGHLLLPEALGEDALGVVAVGVGGAGGGRAAAGRGRRGRGGGGAAATTAILVGRAAPVSLPPLPLPVPLPPVALTVPHAGSVPLRLLPQVTKESDDAPS